MRKILSLVAAIAAMSLVLSCEREKSFDQGSREVGVKVNEGASQDVTTKAASENSPYTFEVNGEELSLTESVSKMRIQARSIETKGNPITEAGEYFNEFSLNFYNASGKAYHNPVTVSYESGNWSLAESVFWPEDSDEDISFFATNGKGDSQSVTNTFSKEGVTHIVYSDAGSDPADADDCNDAEGETDLLYAYTKTHMSAADVEQRESESAVSLTFHHALAGIKFKFGNMTKGMTLTDVTLSGIKTSGECDFTDNGGTAEFAWTTGDDANTLSQSFGSQYAGDAPTGTDCDATGDKTFFIIPQEISDDATITLTFEYELEAVSDKPVDDYAGTRKTFTKTIEIKFKDIADGASAWEAGMLYTYNITGNLVFAELGYTIPTICTSMLSPTIAVTAVKTVNFLVSKTEIPEGSVEVQSSRSLTKVYAKFDETSGELTLYTTAPKIFAHPNSSCLFGATATDKFDATTGHLINLTSIGNLANLDTRNVIDMSSMFCGCLSLTSLDLSKFDTSNVKSFANMFRECRVLNENLVVTGFDTSNATNMLDMFCGCKAVQSLDVTKFHTAKVTNMGGMFSHCEKLESLDLSSFNTSIVTNMSGMFQYCTTLTSLDLKNFNTSSVKNMSYMFLRCTAMESLDVTKFDTSNVTNMFGMFMDCWVLPSLDVSGFNTANVTNMNSMFRTCPKLSAINVSGFNTAKVTSMGRMFSLCSSLTSLDVTKFNTAKVLDMGDMFYGCSGLDSLDVTKFDTSKVTSMAAMFAGCSGLTSLDVSKFVTSSVTNMSGMFSACSGLTSLDLSAFNTSNVANMSNMFQNCTSLDSLNVSSFETAAVTNMKYMFNNCSLPSLNLSSFNTSNVTTMDGMFQGCWYTMSLTLGANFSLVATTKDMFSAFAFKATVTNKAKINCSSDLAIAITNDASINLIDTSKVEFVTE